MSEEVPEVPGGAPTGFAPGSRVAGYVLQEQIGAGGMAVVFRAHDPRLDRQVALKILAPAFAADEAFRQRFIRESRAAAAVDDPHIIPVFDAGESDGVLYIAMRLIRGGDVRSLLLQPDSLPPARVADIVAQAASALDAAHDRGLVHRDVKPANMLLDSQADSGRPDHVYLTDFGLSKGTLATSGLTQTGQFLGTLDYISPEQIEGKPVDGRADQYALACAAFELLTGTPPFRRDEAMAVMYAQLSQDPPAASSRRPDLPAAVDDVFARALAKAPADRWANCREFAAELRTALGVTSADSGPWPAPSGSTPTAATPTLVNPRLEATSQPGPETAGAGTSGPESRQRAAASAPETKNLPIDPAQPAHVLTEAYSPSGAQSSPAPAAGSRPRRPAWRSPAVLAAAVVVLLALIAGGVYLARPKPVPSAPPVAALIPPACSTTAAPGKKLTVTATTQSLRYGNPFDVQASRDGTHVFATNQTTLSVLTMSPDQTVSRQYHYYVASSGESAKGLAITSDGTYVAVAVGNQVNVQSATAAEQGASTANAANLVLRGAQPVTDASAVALSRDNQFAFATFPATNKLAVFNLGKALTSGQTQPGVFVGTVTLGIQPTAMALSPDGQWLYVASAAPRHAAASSTGEGVLSVLSVRGLETKPGAALVGQAMAGCGPAGVAVSPDGKTVWVTAQGSDALLGFSAAKLRTQPAHALTAEVKVGRQPTGVIPVGNGATLIVADANLNGLPGADNLAVVGAAAALARKPALIGYIPSGRTPLHVALSPSGRYLYVADSQAAQIQIVDLTTLPSLPRTR